MKKILLGMIALLATSCGSEKIQVEINNPSAAFRNHETIELLWSDITQRLPEIAPETIVVLDEEHEQVPSQVTYEGLAEPQRLIFQVSLPGEGKAVYTIQKGEREKYPVQVFGRFVPERSDDYAWENNLTAYRVYGPALKNPQTPGIDVWVKSTERMIIDDWYAGKDYHTDHGDGMDAYKVGPTLGGGASAPWAYGKLWLSGNYAKQERLDNGPIRTTVRLTYSPAPLGDGDEEGQYNFSKVISLDANSYFNKITDTYAGTYESCSIAAGIALHDVKERVSGNDYIAVTEALSDSKQPEIDGDISLAVILPGAHKSEMADRHLVVSKRMDNGEPMTYWSGSAWSKAGKVTDFDTWQAIVREKREQIENPLVVYFLVYE